MKIEEPNIKHPSIGTAGLPLKITGIVFWGMILLGIIASWILIKNYNETLGDKYNVRLKSAALEVNHLMHMEHGDGLRHDVEKIFNKYEFESLTLELGTDKLVFGVEKPFCDLHSLFLMLHVLDKETGKQTLNKNKLSVCMPDTSKAVAEYRKNILVFMALLFFSFGLVLQAILKKLLSEPFVQMVDTAKSIFDGKSEKRFNETRDDEFGFLGKFINQALNQQLEKSHEIEEALIRAQQADLALSEEKERAEVTIQSLHEAVITTDQKLHIQSLNKSAENMLGYSIDKVRGLPISDVINFVDDLTGELLNVPIEECLGAEGDDQIRAGCGLRSPNDFIIDITMSASPIKNHSGEVMGVVVVIQDVGIAREMERRLSYQASHDWLTSLYNRQEFERHLGKMLESARMEMREHVLCYLDLDQFKIINDTCGHVAGDELIKQVAHMFMSTTRDSDILARLGGDEFGLLLTYCSIDEAKNVIEQLRSCIENFRFVWEEKTFEIGVSIGVVTINAESESIAELLTSADIACYAAKERGKNNIHVFESTDSEMLRRKGEAQWINRIKEAISEDKFCLYYQQIVPVDLKKNKNNHVEILIRMVDEKGKILSPAAFLPAAERYQLMTDIDKWVIEKLFATISKESNYSRIVADQDDPYVFSVNLSGDSIGNQDLLEFVRLKLQEYSIPPEIICFEITETAAISDMANAINFIEAMKALGCLFALDDFGSGMCSFSYLKALPVDYLKIDGSFVKSISSNPIDRELVLAVNQIGHVLNMKTVAEFVEDDEIRKVLDTLGVDYAQGSGIHKPESLDLLFPEEK